MPLLDELSALEALVRYREPPEAGTTPFKSYVGFRPILLSAPHAAAHMRNGEEKMEEEFTAAFARYLAKRTGAHALFATHLSQEDPNWDVDSGYKRRLAALVDAHNIELVIDIHGMTNRHKIGVAIGTMQGQSVGVSSAELLRPFLEHNFIETPLTQLDLLTEQSWRPVVLNHPKFTGGLKSHTVTRFASQTLGIAAIQIELTSAARIVLRSPNRSWPYEYRGDPVGITSALDALTLLISRLAPHTERRC